MGYLLKDEAPEELFKGIEKIVQGDMFLSSAVTRVALQETAKSENNFDGNILQSKIHRPPIMPDYVIRSGFINELESNIIRPLSIVSAGAGYGKSIVVSQWLEQTK
jgi:hypothetical protein